MSSLSSKGFKQEERDHKTFIYYVNGQRTSIHTKVSHSADEIDEFLIGKMKKQLKLSKQQFLDLVDCPLSLEQLRDYYVQNGIVKIQGQQVI